MSIPKTKAEREDAKGILSHGKEEKFWKLITASLQESIEDINKKLDDEDLQELAPDQYKFQCELFKAKKRFLSTLINTPDNLISWLTEPEKQRTNFDPYRTTIEEVGDYSNVEK